MQLQKHLNLTITYNYHLEAKLLFYFDWHHRSTDTQNKMTWSWLICNIARTLTLKPSTLYGAIIISANIVPVLQIKSRSNQAQQPDQVPIYDFMPPGTLLINQPIVDETSWRVHQSPVTETILHQVNQILNVIDATVGLHTRRLFSGTGTDASDNNWVITLTMIKTFC